MLFCIEHPHTIEKHYLIHHDVNIQRFFALFTHPMQNEQFYKHINKIHQPLTNQKTPFF